jgi:putative ABC transport system permease protein
MPFEPQEDPSALPVTKKLDDAVIAQIKNIRGVESVSPVVQLLPTGGYPAAEITAVSGCSSDNLTTPVIVIISSIDTQNPSLLKLSQGELPDNDGDWVVASYKLSDKLAKDGDSSIPLLGEEIHLTIRKTVGGEEKNEVVARVVAIAEEKGTAGDFYTIYMPLEQVIKLIEWQQDRSNLIEREGYQQLIVIASSLDEVDVVTEKLTGEMNLAAISMKDILGGVQRIFIILGAVLGGIGAIALLVAALGIINTMVMAISERTREIGIMKAIGASNRDIRRIFLGEAGFIGLVGGVGGLLIGWLVTLIAGFALRMYLRGQGVEASMITFPMPWWLILASIAFATLVALAAGIYPARRASRLNPLEALRHE